MTNPIKKCVLHGGQSDGTMVDLYPRTNLASVADMTAFAQTLNGAADAATARNTLEIETSKDIINIIYPVGSVITLTNDTDPNKLYEGTTWVKMDAGRVLVSAGTYTEGSDTYTYTLGDKGGEAKHQSTIEEMPVHNHSASISSVGSHAHGIRRRLGYTNDRNEVSSWGTGPAYNRLDEVPQASTEYAGGFNQTISVNNTGGNKSHENRQPYTVVNVWTRTV
nr:MAG TPA: baseplate wedge protein [Caudoviricetes sp.]